MLLQDAVRWKMCKYSHIFSIPQLNATWRGVRLSLDCKFWL